MTMPVGLYPRLMATMLVLVDVLTCCAMWERRASEGEEQWINTVDIQGFVALFNIFHLWPDPLLPTLLYQFNRTFQYTNASESQQVPSSSVTLDPWY